MLALFLGGGCAAPPTPQGTARIRLTSELQPTPLTTNEPRIRLGGAIGEVPTFCVEVSTSGGEVLRPRLRLSALRSASGRMISLPEHMYRMHSVPVFDWPGWHIRSRSPALRRPMVDDVLVPLEAPEGGMPALLEPGSVIRLWIDVQIPMGTEPGAYAGELALIAEERTLDVLPVEVEIWPFVLPERGVTEFLAELDHRALITHHLPRDTWPADLDAWNADGPGAAADEVIWRAARLLREHRIEPVLSTLAPAIRITGSGRISVDWSTYDRTCGPLLDGSAFADQLPVGRWPLPLPGCGEALRQAMLREYMEEALAHFGAKGWTGRAYLEVPTCGPANPYALQEQCAAEKTLLRAVQDLSNPPTFVSRLFPTEITVPGWTSAPLERLNPSPGGWAPAAPFFDPQVMAAERRAGRITWFRMSEPPFSGTTAIHGSAADVRVLAWQGAATGVEAVKLGVVNGWPASSVPCDPSECVAADAHTCMYPGAPFGLKEPVPSVRLKWLRRAAEDAALLQLLEQIGADHEATALAETIVPLSGGQASRTHFADGRLPSWPGDEEPFEQARLAAAGRIREAADRSGWAKERGDAWRALMANQHRLELQVEGVRLRPDPATGSNRMAAEAFVRVHNRTRLPVAGRLTTATMLDPSAIAAERDVGPLSAGGSGLFRIPTYLPPGVWPDMGASDSLATLHVEQGSLVNAASRLALVEPLGRAGPIEIDADLADWPLGTTNVAGHFLLVSPGPDGSLWPSQRRSASATRAYFLRDHTHLFVAIQAEVAGEVADVRSSRNRMTYDQLVPRGEELIELLFDPLNAATRSPQDLYHIAVKASGAWLAEKGVDFGIPCGRHGPWRVDLEVAVRRQRQGWTAELRVPLAAFEAVSSQTVWGLNITRYDLANQEFSTWSGASPNPYDPLTLGNLLLP